MVYAATLDVPAPVTMEDDEDFRVIIDEPGLVVVSNNGIVAGQVNSPVNLSELYFRLGAEGYALTEAIAYEDGVIEILCRDLADLSGLDELAEEAKVEIATQRQEKERELAYA
jgi:hypothetical protein